MSLPKLEYFDPDATYYELGNYTTAGGSVFRVIPKTPGKHAYQLKQYKSGVQRNRDLRAFAFLAKDGGADVHVVRPKSFGERTIWFRDVRGQTLADVLKDPKLPPEEAQRLIAKWNRFTDRVQKRVKDYPGYSRHFSFGDPAKTLSADLERGEKAFDIYLKLDNVIVESGTGELVLIDPF